MKQSDGIEATQRYVGPTGASAASSLNVSVRPTHIDSYRLLAAHAVGVSSGSIWMDELASPGKTAER